MIVRKLKINHYRKQQMAEYEEITKHIDELMKKWMSDVNRQLEDMRVKVSDIHIIHADSVHMMNSLRDFFQKSSSLFGPDAPATKVAAKKTTKKKKAPEEDTLKTIEFQKDVSKPTRYNVYVRLLREEDGFAESVNKSWRKIDKKIPDDIHRIDYVTYYETFLSSTGTDKDNDAIQDIKEQICDEYEKEKSAATKAKKRQEGKKPKNDE
jgi:hypothetical protein